MESHLHPHMPSWLKQQQIYLLTFLWNPIDRSHVHKSPLLVPVLSQVNSFHNHIVYFFKTHFNITFTSDPVSWNLSVHLWFYD